MGIYYHYGGNYVFFKYLTASYSPFSGRGGCNFCFQPGTGSSQQDFYGPDYTLELLDLCDMMCDM